MKKSIMRYGAAVAGMSAILTFATFGIASAAQLSGQLNVGSTGPDVTTLQTFLAQNPSIYPQRLVTGYYGTLTKAAVARFQTSVGLPAVGNVGPLTLSKINMMLLSNTGLDAMAPNISGLTISSTANTATVTWVTNEGARSKVFYSTGPMAATEAQAPATEPFISGTMIADNNYTTSKSMSIPNLSANTTYYYRVESIDNAGNVSVSPESTFTTRSM